VNLLLHACKKKAHGLSCDCPNYGKRQELRLQAFSTKWPIVADPQTVILYVAGFDAVGQSNLTSDVGWGCMLRSGQMLLAQVCVVAGIFEL
jgi:hypothetical protein